ncbi:SDR family NAD(P)-dependent oxidoreductase [Larkinella soli]|uniref:SDR family NAD(P)-dependent oxidoreductase n=1 Tax=Larkinella soli TaxID=1770527 RepID=UPI000FFBA920|nr:SDR family oxidoreductase [Larkinella soli]
MNNGKTALITGASSGIGQELAQLFARDGFNLVLVARNTEALNQLAGRLWEQHQVESVVITKDLSEEDAAEEVYDQVKERGITVDVLVNDAGAGLYGHFATETDWEREKALIHLNVLATTQMTKLFLKDMVARNEGKILNLASLVSITPMPLMAVYAATKAYVYNFTQSLINELKDTKVTITALLPNATDTQFFNRAGAPDVKVTDHLDDPEMVARDAYKALMKGAHKVIPGGIVNKAYEVMSYVAPQEALAGMMRYNMTPKNDLKPDGSEKSAAWAWGLGIAALALAGVALAVAYSDDKVAERVRNRVHPDNWLPELEGAIRSARELVGNGWGKAREAVS